MQKKDIKLTPFYIVMAVAFFLLALFATHVVWSIFHWYETQPNNLVKHCAGQSQYKAREHFIFHVCEKEGPLSFDEQKACKLGGGSWHETEVAELYYKSCLRANGIDTDIISSTSLIQSVK